MLFLGGIVSLFVKEEHKMKICSLFAGISTLFLLKPSLLSILNGEILEYRIYFSDIFGIVNFVIDPLSAFFIIVISFMSFLCTLYANGYMKIYLNKGMHTSIHTLFLMLLILSMICVVTIQNSLFFLIFWEIMSLSSFFLVLYEDNKKEVVKAGIKYLIYMHICVIFLIMAFALLCIKSQSLNFTDFINVLDSNKHIANIIFILFFIGFGTKAGFIPFHNWLPDAHPASPSHVSGLMSGIMIKTGIYGILRILFLIGMPTKFIAYTFLVISIVSALWGVLYAISQHDIKRLLAYHSIENIGIIGIGISIGLLGTVYHNQMVAILGFAGGILHILNHSIFKMLLFFSAGSVYKKTHIRNIELLGGLIKKMPYTGFLFIIGSVAICALPPFNGFISEFLIYAAMILGLPGGDISSFMLYIISLSSLALIGTMAILCFTKVIGVMFLGLPRSEQAQNVDSDVEKIMLIPMSILAALTLVIGVFPQYAVMFVLIPVLNILKFSTVPQEVAEIIALTNLISFLSIIFIAILLILFFVSYFLRKKKTTHVTWGCGYDRANSRMQYTASSYADLFVSTLKPLFKRIPHIKKPKDLFPQEAYYEMEIEDIEEAYIVEPLIKLDEKILTKFERIQNGNMQQYILFGLIFLILALIGLVFIG